ncbi:MAG TPA: hypothetical protein PLB55_25205, partial [Prosthecobacter sp.]|nr:hypothetical protein [Prosthecobacter sp.]
MTFEYLITHEPQRDEPILSILRERLLVVLEDNLNDVEHEALARMVQTDFQRLQNSAPDGALRSILSFKLVLPEETASIQEVVDEFTDALAAAPILHVLKFEDPLLREELAARAEELFAVEMKLRRVLSIIYLHAYPDADPYELLKEEVEQPMSKAKPEKTAMKAAAENQLFHLTFGQYVNLNQRPAIKDFAALIKSQDTYEAFRAELMRQPVQHEDDASLLAEKQNVFWHDYDALVSAGTAAGIGLEALPPVRKAIGSGFDTKTITLSCGKLTTGVTVPQWSSILM